MREIVLDTETTGLDPEQGHRIVEVAALELVNHLPTGKTFHSYVNPERDMPEEAFRVHGLSAEFLADYPPFREVIDPFLEFLADSPLVIHNATFDVRFLNAELARHGREVLAPGRAIDTLLMAQRRFPGAPNNLDALCRRFGVDNSARTLHGALVDCALLAEVYLHLIGGRQTALGLDRPGVRSAGRGIVREVRPPRPHAPSPEELAAHAAFVAKLENPVWNS
ncbi:DNA polymerase III subunit epsilon [Benzoatithermus flavus]|uniref:DNA polymerase III subunit epsilon n=1 Tax=Benzoatithermus flavus TaxID=3108223 RepID=UPI003AADB033